MPPFLPDRLVFVRNRHFNWQELIFPLLVRKLYLQPLLKIQKYNLYRYKGATCATEEATTVTTAPKEMN